MPSITAGLQKPICEPLGLLGHALVGAWSIQNLQGLDAGHHGQRVSGQCACLQTPWLTCQDSLPAAVANPSA